MKFSLKDIESEYGFGDEVIVSLEQGSYGAGNPAPCPWVTPLTDNSVPTTVSQALAAGAGMGLSSSEAFGLFQLDEIQEVGDSTGGCFCSDTILPDVQLNNVDFWLRVFSALVHELYYTVPLEDLGRMCVDDGWVTVVTILDDGEEALSYRAPKGFFHAAVGVARMHMFGLSR